MTTSYNRPPYFDDFNVEDSNFNDKTVFEKNYHRILFQPSYAVQARELNQLQTILQSQIEQFGLGVYEDGTPIINGKTTFVDNVPYIDLTFSNSDVENQIANLRFIETRSGTVDVRAEILSYESIEDEIANTYRLWLRYTRSGASASRFVAADDIYLKDDTIVLEDLDDVVLTGTVIIGAVADVGVGFSLHVDSGVFFIKGCFVHSDDQNKYYIKTNSAESITGEAIFNVIESITTSEADETLLDNAAGSPNYGAPGADRYTITLELALRTSDDDLIALNDTSIYDADEDSIDYIELIKIDQSLVFTPARTRFSELNDTLAQRTFEESGNYAVNPFLIRVREFLNDGTNGGRYTENYITTNSPFGISTAGAAADKLIVEIDPSVAYVEGYRIELANKYPIMIDKARTTNTLTDVNLAVQRGNYVDVVYNPATTAATDIQDLFDIADFGDTIRAIEYRGVISATEPEGATGGRTGYIRYRLYVQNNFDNRSSSESTSLPTGFAYRYLPGTIETSPLVDNSIKDSNVRSAIFPLPYEVVSAVSSMEYTKQKNILGSFDAGTTYDFSGEGGIDDFGSVSVGEIILFVDDGTQRYLDPFTEISSLTPGSNSLSIEFNNTGNINFGVDTVYAAMPVRVSDSSTTKRRTKTLTAKTETVIAVDANGFVVLAEQDVIIDSITSDVDFIVIDNGQNESFYDSPVLKFDSTPTSISYNYYVHGGGDYFTVDSYLEPYEDIPFYKSRSLGDYLDFRVKRTKTYNGGLDKYEYDVISSMARILSGDVQVSFTHYLPRQDVLLVDTKGEFFIASGQPGIPASAPELPGATMKLYYLTIPAYTFNASDVGTIYVDNKRYRMQDIGQLEKRISDLEYYTSLTLLEKEAADKKILDLSEEGAGAERFKNGILVDSFLGHSVGDPTNVDYLCSIDRVNQILRPYYLQENYRLKFNGKVNGSVPVSPLPGEVGSESLSLDIGNYVPLYENLNATQTMSVQPFEVTVWEGNLKLSPSSDEWIDTVQRPALTFNLNGFSDAIEALANQTGLTNGSLGTEWNAWQNNWQSVSTTEFRTVEGGHRTGTFVVDQFGAGMAINVQNTATTITTNQTRTGNQRQLRFGQLEQDLGDRVVDLNIVPFIRSRDVYFRGSGFKPNTKLYAFFDEEDVTDYVAPSTYVAFGESNDVTTYTGSGAPGGIFATDLVSDDNGNVEGVFRIPNNDELRFRTGDRIFRLTDNSVNNELEADSFATANYSASGLVQEREQTILSTRAPEIGVTQVIQNRTVQNTTLQRQIINRFDPVAQTFYVRDDHPDGAFLSSIDLYFATKPVDETLGVEIYLVSVENGIPTTNVVPGTRVYKQNSEVNVTGRTPDSSDPITDNPTNFTFDIPVYCKSETEYAVVIFSVSPEYRIWTSELGGIDVITGAPVTKNPSFGVLLKSQNKRTWTPDQTKDVMMKLNKIVFPIDTTKTFQFTTLIGSDNQNIDEFMFSLFNLSLETLRLPGTTVNYDVAFYDDTSPTPLEIVAPSDYTFLKNKENYHLRSALGDTVNEIRVTARMSTTSADISPIIDVERCSIIGVQNYVNDPVSLEEGAEYDDTTLDGYDPWSTPVTSGGNALSRYITRTVTLANPSEDLRVLLALNRPSTECNIKVYAKRRPTSDAEASFANDIAWYEMQVYAVDSNTSVTTLPITDREDDYTEVEYILPTPDPNFEDVIGDDGFSEFAIKIVFTSSDIAKVVTIKDLRCIASV